MSTVVKGFAARAGYKKATVWGTPVVLGAGDQIEYNSESLTPDSQFIPDEQVSGEATKLFGDKGDEFHSGDLNVDFRYQGLERLLAHAMGSDTTSQIGLDDAYKHVMKPAKNKEGIFGTFAIDKVFEVWEYPTCKVGGFSMSLEHGKRLVTTFPLIPQGLNINTSSGTNTTTTIANLTLPSNRDFALFSQAVLRMNDTDGPTLVGTTPVYISTFTLQVENSYPTDDVTTRHGYRIDEPVQDGWTLITGTIGFSKYMTENKAWMADMLSKARRKAWLKFTGPIGAGMGPNPFSLDLYFPDIQFSSAPTTPNISGPGKPAFTLAFEAHRKLAAPTGFPAGYTDALTIELVNQVNASAL